MVRKSKGKGRRRGKSGRISFGPSQKANRRRQVRRVRSAPANMNAVHKGNKADMSMIRDAQLGPGIRISATNTLAGVKGWSGYTYALDGSPYWAIEISPDIMSNGIAALAAQFTYYRFTSLSFQYCPAVSTATARNVRFAYVPDGAYSVTMSQPTYAGLADFEYNWSTNVWAATSYKIRPVPRGQFAYLNKSAASTGTDRRQTTQGTLLAILDSDPGATLSFGSLIVDFTIEFFGKSTGLGFTLAEYREYMAWKQSRKNEVQEVVRPPSIVIPDDEKSDLVEVRTDQPTPISQLQSGAMPGPTPQRALAGTTSIQMQNQATMSSMGRR